MVRQLASCAVLGRPLAATLVVAALLWGCGDPAGPGERPAMIAYVQEFGDRFEPSGLLLIAPDGPERRQLLSDVTLRWLDWSPDGATLVTFGDGPGIRLVDAESGAETIVLDDQQGSIEWPRWSPDGTRLAYRNQVAGQEGDIWVARADGTERVNISRTAAVDDLFMDWSPDGTRVVYQAQVGGVWQLWIATADGASRTRVTTPNQAPEWPRWSPDGEWISFHGANGVFIVRPDGSEQRAVTPNCDDAGVCDPSQRYYYAEWSPGGDWLALIGSPSGGDQVVVVRPDGSELRQLTQSDGGNSEPRWSPDGRRLVFKQNIGPTNAIFVIGADGTGQQILTETRWAKAFPRWRP